MIYLNCQIPPTELAVTEKFIIHKMMFEESYTLQAEYTRILPLNFSHSKIIKKYIFGKKK